MQGGKKLDFVERAKCKPFLLRISLAGNLEKPLMSLYGNEWRERGYGLRFPCPDFINILAYSYIPGPYRRRR